MEYRARIRAFSQWCDGEIRRGRNLSDTRIEAWEWRFEGDTKCYGDVIDDMLYYCMYAFEEGSGEVLTYDEMLREIALFDEGHAETGLRATYASPDFLDAGYRRFDVRTMHDEVYSQCFSMNWISRNTSNLELLFPNLNTDETTETVHGLQRRRLFSKRSEITFGFKWFVQKGVHVVIPKDINLARMNHILWAISDDHNTFSNLDRRECGLNLEKHGNERQGKDYVELFFRLAQNHSYERYHHASCTCFQCRPNGERKCIIDRERTIVLKKDTSMYLLLEQLGGTSLTTNEIVDMQARFVFFSGAKVEETDESAAVIPRLEHFKARTVQRRLLWLVLHRRDIHDENVSKAIMRLADLV
jgi:hypothetical protein